MHNPLCLDRVWRLLSLQSDSQVISGLHTDQRQSLLLCVHLHPPHWLQVLVVVNAGLSLWLLFAQFHDGFVAGVCLRDSAESCAG